MKVINIVGARPQFIKAAPVLRTIEQYNRSWPDRPIQEILVHTGQHYDYELSKVFFEELKLKEPDHHLGVGSGTHAYQTGEMLKRIIEARDLDFGPMTPCISLARKREVPMCCSQPMTDFCAERKGMITY